ncbi:MAG TPA: YdeI/OmpD-associated family protein [Candidatus Elarobacter sp.]|jgi:uncharacterized protein YdeI (YjbR/CyaY-like superfamily)|nr:YdeI/OmpD-associated family protein [Candidatus Elarobacter sp.]
MARTKSPASGELEVPEELVAALKRRPGLKKAFDGFSLPHRREYVQWVGEGKRPETRAARAEKAVTMILERNKI